MNINFNNSTTSTVNPEPVVCREAICTRCIHLGVCKHMPSYCNILEQIDGLDIPTVFKADLSCIHFQPMSVL